MKVIKIAMLKLRNFKGIKELYVDFEGNEIKIYGKNGSGKTSTYDAFLWLLFDKDSQNKKDFAIKPLNQDGSVQHNLETEVEGGFIVNDQIVKLRKVYYEKWTSVRGVSEKSLTGHTTDYYVNDVPCKKKEYMEHVAAIVDENLFKLLTSTTYFNGSMKWQDMREVLIAVAGDISDAEVIGSKEIFIRLNELLNCQTIENMKKIVSDKKKKLNEELKSIPFRIDEIKSMYNNSEINIEDEVNQLNEMREEVQGLMNQRSAVLNGEAISTKKVILNELTIEANNIKNEIESASNPDLLKQQVKVQECEANIQVMESQLNQVRQEYSYKQETAKKIKEEYEKLEKLLSELRSEFVKFRDESNDTCNTCNQEIKDESIKSKLNEKKTETLYKINEQGKSLSNNKNSLQDNLNSIEEDLARLKLQGEGVKERLKEAKVKLEKEYKQLESIQINAGSIETNERYKVISESIERVKSEIEALHQSSNGILESIEEDINELNKKIKEKQTSMVFADQAKVGEVRIKELEELRNELVTEIERNEEVFYLINEFEKTKVEMLESKINSSFKYARFKLFEEQVNGEVVPTCKTLYEGVPYNEGLNNGAKINVGIDIINTLSKHYKISAPVFIDNAESVTHFIDVDNQVIKMIVSESDLELRIEGGK